MKKITGLFGRVVRLIGSKVLVAVAIGVLVPEIPFGYTQTPPPATASVTIWVHCGNSETNQVWKPTADVDGLTHACAPQPYNWGTDTTTYAASGTAGLKFVELDQNGIPSAVGKITGNLVSSFNGYNKNNALAGTWAYFWYYFNIVRKVGSNPPFLPSTIPIKFTARGKGSVDQGYGYFDIYVVVGMYGTALPTYFPRDLFRITHGGKGAYAACFGKDPNTCSQTIALDLPVNDPRQPYQVQLAATSPFPGATTPYDSGWHISNNVSRVSVYVDNPIVSLDQATFNTKCAQQGKTPFALSSYYKLVFSPNLNIQ